MWAVVRRLLERFAYRRITPSIAILQCPVCDGAVITSAWGGFTLADGTDMQLWWEGVCQSCPVRVKRKRPFVSAGITQTIEIRPPRQEWAPFHVEARLDPPN